MEVLKQLAEDLLRQVRPRASVLALVYGVDPTRMVEVATALYALGAYYGPHDEGESRAWERKCELEMEAIFGDESDPAAPPLPTVEELTDALRQLDTVHTGAALRGALALLTVRQQHPATQLGLQTEGARLALLEALPPLAEFHYFEVDTTWEGVRVRVPSRWGILAKALLTLNLLDIVAGGVGEVGHEENALFREVCGPCDCALRQVYAAYDCAHAGSVERRQASWFEQVVEDAARVRGEQLGGMAA